MKNIFRVITLLTTVGLMSTVEATTSKYELTNISSQGALALPGLEFNRVSSAILTVTKNPPNFQPNIVSLEVNFPGAEKLTATNFKLVDGYGYSAVVSDAWIYREVIVDLGYFNVEGPLHIGVIVSDKTDFINPTSNIQTISSIPLINIFGEWNEITPTRVIDQQVLTVVGKKLTLSLRDRVLYRAPPATQSFAVDALWAGKGTKSLNVPVELSPSMFDTLEAIAFVIDGNINDPMISVNFKDQSGNEQRSRPVRLYDLLDQAYGPTPWPPL